MSKEVLGTMVHQALLDQSDKKENRVKEVFLALMDQWENLDLMVFRVQLVKLDLLEYLDHLESKVKKERKAIKELKERLENLDLQVCFYFHKEK